jgi:serine phosphatase RsbU (regulator of sigma subunit)/PAS domain-containing protein
MQVDNQGNPRGGGSTFSTDARREVERAAARALSHAHTLEEAATQIITDVCEALDWEFGALWEIDLSRRGVTCVASWSRNPDAHQRFEQISRESTLPSGVGLPGRIWDAGEPIWIADVVDDENFPRAAMALESGLHGAFGFPIASDGEVVGVIEFFSGHIEEPDDELLGMLKTIGTQIGESLTAKRLEQELVFQKAALESQGEAALDGILLVSTEQRVLWWNRRLVAMWGIPESVLEEGDAFEVNVAMAKAMADPSIFDEIREAIRADPGLARRDQMVLGDGRVFDRWTAPVRTPEGRTLGRTVYYRDITREKRFEEQLRESEQWSAFLAEASTLLAESLDVEAILDRLAHLAVPTLADWCSIHLVDEEGTPVQLAVAHSDPSLVELAKEVQTRYPPDPRVDTGVHGVVRSRSPLLLGEIPDELINEGAQDEEHLALLQRLGLRSAMVVPIICRDRVLGAISLVAAESDRRFTSEDLARAMELAGRAAFPIDNARLYQETRVVAQTLQKSFLPPELPAIPGVDIAARYFPAGEGIEIGGDFYDAFRIDARRFGFVLGDVSGKGLEAATVTTLARHTIRGAALTARHPSEALRVLNAALIEQNQTDRFCTAVYAIVDPGFARIRVTVSSGGHPPPYVIRNDGTVEPVDCGGTLLGFIDDVSLRDADVELEFGDKLFLYTDGVLDIRMRSGMFGQDGLEKLLYECAKRGTDGAAEHISQTLADLQDGVATDDIAFILMGVRSSVFSIPGRKLSRRFARRAAVDGG